MKYLLTQERKFQIGERIRKLRKERHKNLESFLDDFELYFETDYGLLSESSMKAYESGRNITLDALMALSEFFDCDIDYLLCNIDEKTHKKVDIKQELGLSDAVIDILSADKAASHRQAHIINKMVEKGFFGSVMFYISQELQYCNKEFYPHGKHTDKIMKSILSQLSQNIDTPAPIKDYEEQRFHEYALGYLSQFDDDTLDAIDREMPYYTEHYDGSNICGNPNFAINTYINGTVDNPEDFVHGLANYERIIKMANISARLHFFYYNEYKWKEERDMRMFNIQRNFTNIVESIIKDEEKKEK